MDEAYFTLEGVNLPPGGTIRFALNASVPPTWIGDDGQYLSDGRIYWHSPVSITATASDGTPLGTFDTEVGGWENGIWYFNGGGPYAYLGGQGLYPAYGTA